MKYYVMIINMSMDSVEGFVRELDTLKQVKDLQDLYPPPLYAHTAICGNKIEIFELNAGIKGELGFRICDSPKFSP